MKFKKENVVHNYTGVDRCSNSNDAMGEAVSMCSAIAYQAAEGFGMKVKEGTISVNLKSHTSEDHKDRLTGKRRCDGHVIFDCYADVE
jgi:hypothetical protein